LICFTFISTLTVVSSFPLVQNQIHKAIIIGGSTRIPAIQTALKQILKRDVLDQHLNADEAMAFGAVFVAANMRFCFSSALFLLNLIAVSFCSTAHRVRPLGLVDMTLASVSVQLSDLAAPANPEDAFAKKTNLFPAKSKLGKRKTVAFSHGSNFQCSLFYDQAEQPLPSATQLPVLHVYNITGIDELVNDAKYSELLKTQKPRFVFPSILVPICGLLFVCVS
jgi:hypothetical protein